MTNPLASLTDQELIDSIKRLVKDERGRTVSVLKHLAEMDRRRLAEGSGFPSLNEYCVRELRYANGSAARRIHAARAAAKFRIIYRAVERGLLSVTTVSLLAPHLTRDNHRRLIRSAAGKSAREVEAQIAAMVPAPAPVERARYVGIAPASPPLETPGPDILAPSPPAKSDVSTEPAPKPAPPPVLRVQFSFTAEEKLLHQVERAKELLRHSIPAGRYEDIFAAAISALLDTIDPERRLRRLRSRTRAANANGRRIPSALRDEVWRRDGGRCAFRSGDGRPCGARARLQVDRVVPWARGGPTELGNLRLLCRAHNLFEARRVFGDAAVGARLSPDGSIPR